MNFYDYAGFVTVVLVAKFWITCIAFDAFQSRVERSRCDGEHLWHGGQPNLLWGTENYL